MTKQKPTNCMDETCPYHRIEGIPDFVGDNYVCTVHFECALGFTKECTPNAKILLWYKKEELE